MLGMIMNTARTLFVVIACVMALLAFGYQPGSAQARRKITVAFVAPSISQAIPWIAKEAGIFAKHGVDADVILLTGSPRLVQTLVAGDVDYAIVGVTSVLRARMRGADTAILATGSNYSSQRVLVRPQSPLHRLEDLKEKIVGVTQGSVRALQKYMRGATPEQIAVLYEEQRDLTQPLPLPIAEAIQAVLDRESDPKARNFKPADFVDLSFLREIERSGLIENLYRK